MELKSNIKYSPVASPSNSSPPAPPSLYDALPENAKIYYKHPVTDTSLSSLVHQWTLGDTLCHCLGFFLIYPLTRITYLAANEVMVTLEGGTHRIVGGPGLRFDFFKDLLKLLLFFLT